MRQGERTTRHTSIRGRVGERLGLDRHARKVLVKVAEVRIAALNGGVVRSVVVRRALGKAACSVVRTTLILKGGSIFFTASLPQSMPRKYGWRLISAAVLRRFSGSRSSICFRNSCAWRVNDVAGKTGCLRKMLRHVC